MEHIEKPYKYHSNNGTINNIGTNNNINGTNTNITII